MNIIQPGQWRTISHCKIQKYEIYDTIEGDNFIFSLKTGKNKWPVSIAYSQDGSTSGNNNQVFYSLQANSKMKWGNGHQVMMMTHLVYFQHENIAHINGNNCMCNVGKKACQGKRNAWPVSNPITCKIDRYQVNQNFAGKVHFYLHRLKKTFNRTTRSIATKNQLLPTYFVARPKWNTSRIFFYKNFPPL